MNQISDRDGEPAPVASARVQAPSVFMRGRRPTLFSDSLLDQVAPLGRIEFEYRLQTITARSEEAQFQRFIHALLEVEVCPNLLPQTGPSGGGDSKVDTETYTVSDAIAERWWSGTAREASHEQWAFAISAMQDWRKKARKDVANVLASGRTYQRIHFVTNQFVRDKDRDKLEKELTRRAGGIPVRIFDRTWILQAVYDHDHWVIAERELGLPASLGKSPGSIGPLDADRARQLAQVETEIADPQRFANSLMQLAYAWLTSALLARGLGRAREEVDQRFDRAIEAARRSESTRGLRRMLYQKAWTAFWWFDDAAAVVGGYDTIEALFDDDVNAWDLEQVTNLYTLLNSAEMHGWLPNGAANLEARRSRLRSRLEALAGRRAHPTDAAWARTHLLHLRFLEDPESPQVHAELIKGTNALLREAERLPEYPVETLCDVISIFTELPFNIAGIDALADRAGELIGQRVGAQAQARQLLDRATHKVAKNESEEAIRLLGRAWRQLMQQPSRELFLEGAAIAAQAYCDVGLFCAARAHLLLGLDRSVRTIVKDAKVSGNTLFFALRLAWVELAAGRLALILDALRMADAVAMALDLSEASKRAYLAERNELEALLVRMIVASDPKEVEAIRLAPAVFRQRQLQLAEQASLALLGHPEDSLVSMTDGMRLDAIQAMPWPVELGPIEWDSGETATVQTRILGCDIIASGIGTQEARSLVMALFAALEGFAAIGFGDHLMPVTDRVALTVDDTLDVPTLTIEVEEDDCGEPRIRVRFACGTLSSYATTTAFRDKAIDCVITIVGHVCSPGSRADLKRMFAVDAVQDRAFGLLQACALDNNAAQERATLEGLLTEAAPPYDLLDGGRFVAPKEPAAVRNAWDAKMLRISEEKVSPPKFHHRNARVASVMNNHLWTRARCMGVGFTYWPNGAPGISLLFGDADAGAKIMRGLQRRIGDGEAESVVRIAILTDIDKDHPAHYRVAFLPAAAATLGDPSQTMMITVPSKTMTPEHRTNLDTFLEKLSTTGHFLLDASAASGGLQHPPITLGVDPIRFRHLDVKAAWQIDPNDSLFGMMIRSEDRPYIPKDVKNSSELAVVKLIAALKKRK